MKIPGPSPFSLGEPQNADPELSYRQEILRAMFANDPDRAIRIESDLFKSNPADPLVLSTLNMLATSRSEKALPMLLDMAKNSSNVKARKDAIFWISQSRGDKDSIVDTLTGLLPSASTDEAEAVSFALGQIHTDKAINALAAIARDKNRTEATRNSALLWIGQSRVPNRIALLEDIYKNGGDNLSIRRQVLFALGQTRDPQAVTLLSNIASSDPNIELRRQAVFSLGQIKSPEATQALENLLQKK
jgi:HEAT repeat protein